MLGGVWAGLWLVCVCLSGIYAREYGGEYARSVQATAVASPSAKSTPSPPSVQRITSTPTLIPRQASSSGSSSSSNDDELPAGGLTVTQPAQTADESYYKIAAHETITFGWSFTSLKTQPSRLFVVASCSQNGYTYPIAASPSGIAGDATSVTWYPYGYRMSALANGQPDLLAAKYRLIIYDEQGISAAAHGGQFSPSNALQFAMYFPQAYTPLAQWTCGSCSSAPTVSYRTPFLAAILCTVFAGGLSALWLLPIA